MHRIRTAGFALIDVLIALLLLAVALLGACAALIQTLRATHGALLTTRAVDLVADLDEDLQSVMSITQQRELLAAWRVRASTELPMAGIPSDRAVSMVPCFGFTAGVRSPAALAVHRRRRAARAAYASGSNAGAGAMKRAGGFSLTELVVAAALLATVTAGGLQAFARAQQSRREGGVTQQLHERAQYTFATLETELQMAGYFAGAVPTALPREEIPAGAAQCGSELVARLDIPVAALDRWTLACEARDDPVSGSDVLIVRRVSARLAGSPERGRAQWLSDVSETASGRVFWQGDAPWSPADAARGHELRDLLVRVYYVAGQADGDDDMPALRVKSLTSIAGTPAFIDTEVMPGVEAMEVELVPTSTTPATVQLTLRVRADPTGARDAAAPRTLQVTRHFALRNVAG